MGKKEEILASALELFSTQGYENVGIQKIVESVDVKKPTLYHYFGSKNGLLDSILDFYLTPYLVELEINSEYSGDIVLTLERLTKFSFNYAKNNPQIYTFMINLFYSPAESEANITAEPYLERQFAAIEGVFKKAESDHGNMKGRSYNFATTFLGMLTVYINSYLNKRITLTDKEVYEACRQFMYGIFS